MIDKNHPLTMVLFKICLGLVFLTFLDVYLALSLVTTLVLYVTVGLLTNHWVEWSYWQLVISWHLLMLRFKK